MKDLLLANINKSFRKILEKPKVPKELVEIIDESKNDPSELSICEVLAYDAVKHIPWFYRDSNHELQSPQEEFFGFYALRNVLRGMYISLRFFQAGDILLNNHFCALSTFSYYTASFHLLQSFLALHGYVLIELVHGPPYVIKRDSSGESYNAPHCQDTKKF